MTQAFSFPPSSLLPSPSLSSPLLSLPPSLMPITFDQVFHFSYDFSFFVLDETDMTTISRHLTVRTGDLTTEDKMTGREEKREEREVLLSPKHLLARHTLKNHCRLTESPQRLTDNWASALISRTKVGNKSIISYIYLPSLFSPLHCFHFFLHFSNCLRRLLRSRQ